MMQLGGKYIFNAKLRKVMAENTPPTPTGGPMPEMQLSEAVAVLHVWGVLA